jgi:hypothetical protein
MSSSRVLATCLSVRLPVYTPEEFREAPAGRQKDDRPGTPKNPRQLGAQRVATRRRRIVSAARSRAGCQLPVEQNVGGMAPRVVSARSDCGARGRYRTELSTISAISTKSIAGATP